MANPWGLLIGAGIVAGAWMGPVALLPLIWVVLVGQGIRGRFSWLPVAIALVAVLVGAGRAALEPAHQVPPNLGESTHAAGSVVSMTRGGVTGGTVLISVEEIGGWNDLVPVSPFLTLVTLPDGMNVARGDEVLLAWSASPLAETAPGYGGYVEAQGAVATARAWDIDVVESGSGFFRTIEDLRDRISRGLMTVLPGDRGALAAGIVTGDDSALSEEAENAFRNSGTTHITAVSGTNVAMVLALWATFMRSGRSRRMLIVQLIMVATIWFYALLTGLEPPAARAATMATLMLFGSRFGRRPDPMTLLALTSAAMVLWNPRNVDSIAFWLSVVATAAIVSRIPPDLDEGWQRSARTIGEGVLLAQAATLPVVLTTFGTWSLTSVLANVLLSPMMLVAFPLTFVLGAVVAIAPSIAPLIAWIPGIVLGLALQLVEDLSTLLPPVSIDATGYLPWLMVGVPGLLTLLVLSRDGGRWVLDLEHAWSRRPVLIALLGIAPLVGFLSAVIVLGSQA